MYPIIHEITDLCKCAQSGHPVGHIPRVVPYSLPYSTSRPSCIAAGIGRVCDSGSCFRHLGRLPACHRDPPCGAGWRSNEWRSTAPGCVTNRPLTSQGGWPPSTSIPYDCHMPDYGLHYSGAAACEAAHGDCLLPEWCEWRGRAALLMGS